MKMQVPKFKIQDKEKRSDPVVISAFDKAMAFAKFSHQRFGVLKPNPNDYTVEPLVPEENSR